MNVGMFTRTWFALPLVACATAAPQPSPLPAGTPAQAAPPPAQTSEADADQKTEDVGAATNVLTPEERKKAEDAKQLLADWAQLEADARAELARWTPELHAQTKALADKAYPTTKAALESVLKGKHRV